MHRPVWGLGRRPSEARRAVAGIVGGAVALPAIHLVPALRGAQRGPQGAGAKPRARYRYPPAAARAIKALRVPRS